MDTFMNLIIIGHVIKLVSSCEYVLQPVTKTFGAEVVGISLMDIDNVCADRLKHEAFMYRFLLFRDQTLTWQDQIRFTEQLGQPFVETSSINRKRHEKIPDQRLGVFSNDPAEGLTMVGVEGWHVDGNVAQAPHMFTLIYCVSNNKNGPTLVVPLREIVNNLSDESRRMLENVYFVSAHNSSIIHPLLYKDPNRNDDTIMIALGKLSGQYLEALPNGTKRNMTLEETRAVMDLLEMTILTSNQIYGHHYRPGDLLMLYNPSVAHMAGPGSQTPRNISGLRLMTRSTVAGTTTPSPTTHIRYYCNTLAPFENGYCLFSLKGSVYYPSIGKYDSFDKARERCKNINKHADLAVLPSVEWNEFAKEIISRTEVPHWLNANNPEGTYVFWEGFSEKSDFTLWDQKSGQPNDHDMFEDCVVMGPYGHWFDLPCSGPKTAPGTDPGPVMTWEDGERRMYNVYPLCGVSKAEVEEV